MSEEYVYELIDATCDERYYTYGLFRSIEEAVEVATTRLHTVLSDYEDYMEFHVNCRPIGTLVWQDSGKYVAQIHWSYKWPKDEDSDGVWGAPVVTYIKEKNEIEKS